MGVAPGMTSAKDLFRRVFKRNRPSYEDERFRDPGVEDLQDPTFRPDDLKKAIKSALQEGRSKSS
jgi:hypothetical protein